MSPLISQLESALPAGMLIPSPIRMLFDWIEQNGFFYVDAAGQRVGLLYSPELHWQHWPENERPGGTIVEFSTEGNAALSSWFGHESAEISNRLCVFARTGSEGSMGALWLAPDGTQRIVHMGSGSGSTLVCVLADDPIDFLRLLAIGYDEICWPECWTEPPNLGAVDDDFVVYPNYLYQDWVRITFGVEIPSTGMEIVSNPVEMDDSDSSDEFWCWVNSVVN